MLKSFNFDKELLTNSEACFNNCILDSLLDSISDCVFLKNKEGVYSGCNKKFENLVGRKHYQIIGKTDYEIFDKDMADLFRKKDEFVMESGEIAICEEYLKCPDGKMLTFETSKTTLQDAAGDVIGVMGVARNVTEYKYCKNLLNLKASALDQIEDMVTITDLDGIITYVNDAQCKRHGKVREDLIGKSVGVFNDSQENDVFQKQIIENTIKQGRWSGEIVNSDKAGNCFFVDCRTFLIKDEDNQPNALIGIAHDVTKQKRHKNLIAALEVCNLLLSEKDLRLSINESINVIGNVCQQDRVYIFENHKDEQGNLLTSQRYEWVAPGVSAEIDNPELQNVSYQNFVPRWYSELSCGRTIEGLIKDFPEQERSVLQNQGIVSILVVPIMVDNQFYGFLGFDNCHYEYEWSDSERSILKLFASSIGTALSRKRKEDQLRISNAAKNQFLANMSHELRTPLNSIIGFSQMLNDEHFERNQKEFIDIINTQGRILLHLVNDILDFSTIEADSLKIYIQECSVDEVLSQIESIFSPMAQMKKIGIEFEKDINIPPLIKTDAVRLNQCLINLINNALKFTDKGGVSVKVYSEKNNDKLYIKFEIADTGIGIPNDKKTDIFDSFFQVDYGHSRKYGGAGLGLAITKKLAQLLGGDLTFISEPNKGSVFTLKIYAGDDIYEPDINLSFSSAKTLRYTPCFTGLVLVVEDSVMNQKLLKLMLEKMGLTVFIAGDGLEALEKVRENSFDLIFMDIQMPRMNGYDATRQIRKAGINTPIISITANAMQSDRKDCFNAGCDEYLSKPVNYLELADKIREFL
ncbi:MAG: response regulator [Sedimentisphaeraceae bacterium JB056]